MRVEIDVWNGFTQETELLKQLEYVKERYSKQFESSVDISLQLVDNPQLEDGGYVFKIDGVVSDSGILQAGRFLALKYEHDDREFEGDHITDPVFELPAVWVDPEVKDKMSGNKRYTVVDHFTIIATHLCELLRVRP